MTNANKPNANKPTTEDYALAAQVAEWMLGLSETEQSNDYLHNLGIYGKCGVVNTKGLGIVASAIQAFNRDLAKRAESASAVSKHIGKEKERLTLQVRLTGVFDSHSDFGASYIHKFEIVGGPDAGARVTWFGSSRLRDNDRRVEIGDVVWIKATVKRYGEFKGVLETHVSRAELTLSPEEAAAQKAALAAAKKAEKKAAKEAARKST